MEKNVSSGQRHVAESKDSAVESEFDSLTPSQLQADDRPETKDLLQRKSAINESPQVQQLKALQRVANSSGVQQSALQRKASLEASGGGGGNQGGLPDNLRTGMEQLSGMDMSDVRVHRNSSKAAEAGALAYAQGNDIHFGAGQEQHLPHEAWHVVQQRQGRVKPTTQAPNGAAVNDDRSLESEADVMGEKAVQMKANAGKSELMKATAGETVAQRVIKPYKSKKLRGDSNVLKGLTEEQIEEIQNLHSEEKVYSIDEARELVGAKSLEKSKKRDLNGYDGKLPPFVFRYDVGDEFALDLNSKEKGGIIYNPKMEISENDEKSNWQMSFVEGSRHDDLQKGSKREISQGDVMDKTSPNKAAKQLGFDCPSKLSWEWLHLVAFSLGETHVGELSKGSKALIRRTGQPQQIRENLVLGTAAANTAMLSFETEIKEQMKQNKDLRLRLVVSARKDDMSVKNEKNEKVKIPVGNLIKYDFVFFDDNNKVSPPVLITFDLRDHQKPTVSEYGSVVETIQYAVDNMKKLKFPLQGINEDPVDQVQENSFGKKKRKIIKGLKKEDIGINEYKDKEKNGEEFLDFEGNLIDINKIKYGSPNLKKKKKTQVEEPNKRKREDNKVLPHKKKVKR